MSIQSEIDAAAIEVLNDVPEGVRFSELWKRVYKTLPHCSSNSA